MYAKDKSTISIVGLTATNNKAKGNGGVFYITETGTSLTLDGALSVSGTVGSADTLVYLSGSTLNIDKSEFVDPTGAALDWAKLIKNTKGTVVEIA